MRNGYGSQASPQRSSSGYLPGSPVSHLEHMASVPSSAQLGSMSPNSLSGRRLSRNNSGRSFKEGTPDADDASPMRPLQQVQSGMSMTSLGRQLDAAGPGHGHEGRPAIATGSRSRSARQAGSRSRMGSAASAWLDSHSAHQLAANVKALAAEVRLSALLSCLASCASYMQKKASCSNDRHWPIVPLSSDCGEWPACRRHCWTAHATQVFPAPTRTLAILHAPPNPTLKSHVSKACLGNKSETVSCPHGLSEF